MELDPALAQAHATSARIKSHDWDWPGAGAEFRRAIELNPGDALFHGNYGNFLLLIGKVKEAMGEIRHAQELDPLRVGFQFAEGTALYQARSYDEAVQLFRRIIQAHPEYWRSYVYLGYTYEALGKYAESIEALRTADRVNGEPASSNLCFIGYSYALWGKRDEALAILKQLKSSTKPVSLGELAALYAALGDREAALTALDQAFAAHDPQMENLISDPHYDPLRAEPHFRELVRKVGLSQ
jgi:tetratricopeptide (TPR) repeat protein